MDDNPEQSEQSEQTADPYLQQFTSLAGEPIAASIPPGQGSESLYFLALHKSGSVLLSNMLKDISEAVGQPTFALPEALFNAGVALENCPLDLLSVLERPGYWFYGFRAAWLLPYVRRFRESKKFMLVRDPRDMCVSYYYSIVKSHSLPEQGEIRSNLLSRREEAALINVNDYILSGKTDFILRNMLGYQRLVQEYDVTLMRYEDMIFDKIGWVKALGQFADIKLSRKVIRTIAERHDLRPAEEQLHEHVRQVNPGNYKKNLAEGTVHHLEKRFSDMFRFFGYPLETMD